MPPLSTASSPAQLPKSPSWWLMLSVLAGLLLAGSSLRPKALALANAPVVAWRPAARAPWPGHLWPVAAFSRGPAGPAPL